MQEVFLAGNTAAMSNAGNSQGVRLSSSRSKLQFVGSLSVNASKGTLFHGGGQLEAFVSHYLLAVLQLEADTA